MREIFKEKSEPIRQPLGTRPMPALWCYGKMESHGGGRRFAMLLILVEVFPPEKYLNIQTFAHNSRNSYRDPET